MKQKKSKLNSEQSRLKKMLNGRLPILSLWFKAHALENTPDYYETFVPKNVRAVFGKFQLDAEEIKRWSEIKPDELDQLTNYLLARKDFQSMTEAIELANKIKKGKEEINPRIIMAELIGLKLALWAIKKSKKLANEQTELVGVRGEEIDPEFFFKQKGSDLLLDWLRLKNKEDTEIIEPYLIQLRYLPPKYNLQTNEQDELLAKKYSRHYFNDPSLLTETPVGESLNIFDKPPKKKEPKEEKEEKKEYKPKDPNQFDIFKPR